MLIPCSCLLDINRTVPVAFLVSPPPVSDEARCVDGDVARHSAVPPLLFAALSAHALVCMRAWREAGDCCRLSFLDSWLMLSLCFLWQIRSPAFAPCLTQPSLSLTPHSDLQLEHKSPQRTATIKKGPPRCEHGARESFAGARGLHQFLPPWMCWIERQFCMRALGGGSHQNNSGYAEQCLPALYKPILL